MLNTQGIMTTSALLMGLLGVSLSFLPQEAALLLSIESEGAYIILQLLGAIYFGFAMANWTARGSLIGGIYGRPMAIGNFTHFLIGALALVKIALQLSTTLIFGLTVLYVVFAGLFGYIFFTHPVKKTS